MLATPTVSVVIPCYNAAPFLRETIDSTLKQTCPPLEVIVIDDGSTDESASIAESYGPPVRVIRQENQGESVARNRGMDEAHGEWIALLDADDRWLPQKLERQFTALRDAPSDVACVYSDIMLFGSVRRKVVSCPMWPVQSECRVRMLTQPWISLNVAVISKEIGRKVRFPTDIRYGEERVFWFLFSEHGSIVHVPEPLAEYRKHASQQTSQADHGMRVYASLWEWIKAHPEKLTLEETELFRRIFIEHLIVRHDHAFWRNDSALVEQARSMYREVNTDSDSFPPLFDSPLPTRTKCAMYHTWNATLDMLPPRLRQYLVRISRGPVLKLKRGIK